MKLLSRSRFNTPPAVFGVEERGLKRLGDSVNYRVELKKGRPQRCTGQLTGHEVGGDISAIKSLYVSSDESYTQHLSLWNPVS